MQSMQPDLRTLRRMLGENQADFAKRFGVDGSTLSRWENNGIPPTGTARLAIEQTVGEIIKALEITRPGASVGEIDSQV